jgi:cell division FtsZ-interacting protein ZapD
MRIGIHELSNHTNIQKYFQASERKNVNTTIRKEAEKKKQMRQVWKKSSNLSFEILNEIDKEQ